MNIVPAVARFGARAVGGTARPALAYRMSATVAVRWAVLVHLAVVATHAAAHVALAIPMPSLSANLFIVLVIWLAPLAVLRLLHRGSDRPAALLLVTAMAGALLFGVWFHFVAVSPDHVAHAPPDVWGATFRWSAAALAAAEIAGCGIGVWLLAAARGDRAGATSHR